MDDDLFQSLGGSLMKDLLADLQGDDGEGDGWLSLEQLEKELSQLDDNTAAATTASTLGSLPLPPVPTAASMVVTGQQQFHQLQQQQQQQPIQGVGLLGDVTVTTTTPADAWKESLQKFTALSLDQDFLAADTVRKQQKAATVPVPPPPEQLLPPGFLAEAEDYDDTEKVTIKPPPGIVAGTSASASAGGPTPLPVGIRSAAAVLEEVDDNDAERGQQAMLAAASLLPGAVVPSIPKGHRLPKTPQNSVAIGMSGDDDAAAGQKQRVASRMPKTPRNSVIISSADDLEEEEKVAVTAAPVGAPKQEKEDVIPMMEKFTILKRPQDEAEPAKTKMVPKTPRNSVIVPDQHAAAAVVAASAAAQGMAMPPPSMASAMMHGGMMPPQPGMHLPAPPHMMHGMPPPPHMMHGMPPPPPHMMVPHHPGAVPMGMPAPGGPAWQTGPPPGPPPQPMMPPPPSVFCNPHPNAPPIPAQILESRLMKSRDISYIIHSILKPVLMAGVSEHDYDIQLLFRQSGGRPAGPRPHLGRRPAGGAPGNRGKGNRNNNGAEIDPTMDAIQREMVSREKKAKEWSAKNVALGTVTKSNVARPRALIASPVISQANQDKSESASEQKQRARLWKARIYCDQAYQAYLAVVDVWAKAAPGSVPREVQAPLIRLMKCLGIAPSATAGDSTAAAVAEGGEGAGSSGGGGASDYKVDGSVLELFLKLSKGRTLFARIVEQALLPPSAVQAVLPSTLDILYKTPIPADSSTSASAYGGDLTDDRCFRALTNVIQCLPSLTGNTVLQSAETMKAQSEAALSSTARMECLHALLQRGNAMANSPDPALDDYKGKWKETETSFLNILSGI